MMFAGVGQASQNSLSLRFSGRRTKPSLQWVNQQCLADTFVKLAKVDTVGKENATSFPSTPNQLEMARMLHDELKQIGLKDVKIDKHGVVTGTMPGNLGTKGKLPVIGLIAHYDVSNGAPTDNIQPRLHRNYQGGDIVLGHGTVVPEGELRSYVGQDVITSDGRTLLGGDDKAGVAEILEALRIYTEHSALKHPTIRVAFTPDEETGEFIEHFDVKSFGADAAYTLDASTPDTIEYESFNAYKLDVTVTGYNVHPGYAKGRMINALKIASDFVIQLPPDEAPETTEGRQGYFHPMSLSAEEGQARLTLLIRDFDIGSAHRRIEHMKALAARMEQKYPGSKIEIAVKEQYRNMADHLKNHPEVVAYAREGIRRSGLIPREHPIRGGTDGCTLTLNGLPTPNIGAGEHLFHAKNEFVVVQEMARCVLNVLNILSVWAEKATSKQNKNSR